MADRLEHTRLLHAQGVSVLAAEYRGYGDSEGSPSEEGLAALDAVYSIEGLVPADLDALDALREEGLEMPHGGHWTQAQAHLLLDQGPQALDALGQVRISDDRRRALAIEQARLIRRRLGQEAP